MQHYFTLNMATIYLFNSGDGYGDIYIKSNEMVDESKKQKENVLP